MSNQNVFTPKVCCVKFFTSKKKINLCQNLYISYILYNSKIDQEATSSWDRQITYSFTQPDFETKSSKTKRKRKFVDQSEKDPAYWERVCKPEFIKQIFLPYILTVH